MPATTIIYEGQPSARTRTPPRIWRVIYENTRAVSMFNAPHRVPRNSRRKDPQGKASLKYDLTKFSELFLAGERSRFPTTIAWARDSVERLKKVPVTITGEERKPAA